MLSTEQGMSATAAKLLQLGKDTKENDETLNSALRGQFSQVTTRLEKKNTKLMAKPGFSESSIWEKSALLDAAATGTANAVARTSGAMGPAHPESPPGLALERLVTLEAALKELGERHTAWAPRRPSSSPARTPGSWPRACS